MDAQDFRSLQEAYNQVHQVDEELTGARKQKASDLLNRKLRDVETLRKLSARKRQKPEDVGSGNKARRRAGKEVKDSRIAVSDSYDYYDIILSHLLDEGYAETPEEAEAIIVNMGEEWVQSIAEEILDEAEGSYGQTPKATAAYGKLANKRRSTPASGFSKRGEKTAKVKSAEKHHYRTLNPDAGNRGKKSTKPSAWSGKRSGMTQKDRDEARGGDEYGHTGYDPDFHGGPSAPGGKPKGKKLERQRKTGVSAESFNAYELVLSYLLEEGFASTEYSADKIILNMSESWFEEIMEARRSEKEGKGSPESPLSYPGRQVQKERGERGGKHHYSGSVEYGGAETERGRKKSDPYSQEKRLRTLRNHPEKPGKYSEMQRKKRGGDVGSRFD
jgi:hypothetical protein